MDDDKSLYNIKLKLLKHLIHMGFFFYLFHMHEIANTFIVLFGLIITIRKGIINGHILVLSKANLKVNSLFKSHFDFKNDHHSGMW